MLVLLQARECRQQLLGMHKLLSDGAMSNLTAVNAMVTISSGAAAGQRPQETAAGDAQAAL